MGTGYEHLELREEAGVLRVWLNRPEVRNAFNGRLIAELAQVFTSIPDRVRAVLLGGRVEAHSAGIAPRGLDPRAVRVMAEAGVDISQQRSKHADELKNVEFDLVVTVCDHAREQCPLYFRRARQLHHSFEDPAAAAGSEEEVLAAFRRVRDELRGLVEGPG